MSQFTLKLLAMLLMLCDHLAKVVLSTGVLGPMIGVQADRWLTTVLMVLGRIAFPIFAWFTAEACKKTRSMPKYLLRLLIFALLSEIPFQLCFWGAGATGLRLGCHNVLFTLLLAAGAIYAGERLGGGNVYLRLGPALIAMILGTVLKTDYNAWGVALVLLLYYLPEKKQQLFFLGCWMTVFMLLWHGWNGRTLSWLNPRGYGLLLQWLGGLFSVPLLAAYQGQRGPKCKWLFYCFYPAHLLILYGIRCLILA